MKIRVSQKGIVIVIAVIFAAIVGPLRGYLATAPHIGVPFQYIFYWVDHFKFWGTRAPSPIKRGLEIPTIKGAPLTGTPVGPHFRSSKTYFVLTSDRTPIYTKPSESSRYIETLDIGYRVRAVYQNEDIIATNSEGRGLWVFLTHEDGHTPIGWAINTTIGYQDKFLPVTMWPINTFGMCIGEYCCEFKIKPNGRFTQKWDSIGRGLHIKGTNTGQLLSFKKLIWAKQDDPENYDELLIRPEPQILMHEVKYSGEPIQGPKANATPIRRSKSTSF